MSSPIVYICKPGGMVPMGRFHELYTSEFEVDERYALAEVQDRSMRSHRHYFAAIREGWMNLPEHYAQEFASPEHLRKWCLIRAGYHDSRSIAAASKAEALRLSAFVKPMDEFAVVSVHEATVTVLTAQSQSLKAMGKEAFGKSKQAVLDRLDDMLGVERGEVAANAGKAS